MLRKVLYTTHVPCGMLSHPHVPAFGALDLFIGVSSVAPHDLTVGYRCIDFLLLRDRPLPKSSSVRGRNQSALLIFLVYARFSSVDS